MRHRNHRHDGGVVNGWFIPATIGLVVATGTGVEFDLPLLQYGALGLLGLIIILNYKIGNRMLDKLDTINKDSHAWGSSREERLVAVLKQSDENTRDIVHEVMQEVRKIGE